MDRLNVCDAADEKAHGYRFRSRLGDLRLRGTARIASYPGDGEGLRVADGGRAIVGEETFDIHTRPGRDLVIVARTASSMGANVLRAEAAGQFAIEMPAVGIAVEVDGRRPGASPTLRPPAGTSWCCASRGPSCGRSARPCGSRGVMLRSTTGSSNREIRMGGRPWGRRRQ